MFGFGKKKKQEEPHQKESRQKRSNFDKIILGAVIGGAIGSVIGVGLAPQKGEETRKAVGKKAGKLLEKVGDIAQNILRKKADTNPSSQQGGQQNIPKQEQKPADYEKIKRIPHEN